MTLPSSHDTTCPTTFYNTLQPQAPPSWNANLRPTMISGFEAPHEACSRT